MVRRAAQIAAFLLVVLTTAGLSSEPAPVAGDCPDCGDEVTPRGCAAGIFQCGDGCACCDDTRFFRSEILGRLWVRGEYLAWSMKGQYFPPLVTTSLPQALPGNTGVLGRESTFVLLGDERLLDEMQSGGRLSGGFWWTPEQFGGIEGSFFEVDADSHHRYAGNEYLSLARPYLDVNTGTQESLLVAYPGLRNGSIQVAAETQFAGGEALLRQVLRYGPSYRVDLVGGYRNAHLGDLLAITESVSFDVGRLPTSIDRFDLFQVKNDFHGFQAGVITRLRRNNLSLQLLGKVGLGETITQLDIDGGTAITRDVNGQTRPLAGGPGGLLALPSNMGHYRDSGFATFEELGLNLELQLTCTSRVFCGYSFLYWSRVARVADQLDLGVNRTQTFSGRLLDESRPSLDLTTTDFWAQGLNVGLEYQF